MINLVIADDHKIFRDGLKSIFDDVLDITVIGEAIDGKEVLEILANEKTHVVLMDINMGSNDGISATKTIKDKFPDVKVLILSMHNETGFIVNSMEAGAQGYLLKNSGREETIRAIKAVYAGDTYYGQEVSQKLMAHITKKNKLANEINLTKREIEILKLIAEENTNSEIAKQLFISIRTVDTHRRNLLEKLQVKNTVGLVKFAIKNGYLNI